MASNAKHSQKSVCRSPIYHKCWSPPIWIVWNCHDNIRETTADLRIGLMFHPNLTIAEGFLWMTIHFWSLVRYAELLLPQPSFFFRSEPVAFLLVWKEVFIWFSETRKETTCFEVPDNNTIHSQACSTDNYVDPKPAVGEAKGSICNWNQIKQRCPQGVDATAWPGHEISCSLQYCISHVSGALFTNLAIGIDFLILEICPLSGPTRKFCFRDGSRGSKNNHLCADHIRTFNKYTPRAQVK